MSPSFLALRTSQTNRISCDINVQVECTVFRPPPKTVPPRQSWRSWVTLELNPHTVNLSTQQTERQRKGKQNVYTFWFDAICSLDSSNKYDSFSFLFRLKQSTDKTKRTFNPKQYRVKRDSKNQSNQFESSPLIFFHSSSLFVSSFGAWSATCLNHPL